MKPNCAERIKLLIDLTQKNAKNCSNIMRSTVDQIFTLRLLAGKQGRPVRALGDA